MKFRPQLPWLGALALMWAAQAGAAPLSPADPAMQALNAPSSRAVPAPAVNKVETKPVLHSLGPQLIAPQSQASEPEMIVHRGERLSQALSDFAKQQGWTVLWYCQDWAAPGQTIFHGDFMTVSQEFIKSISSDGADIHGKWWLGNKTLVVTGSGAMQ